MAATPGTRALFANYGFCHSCFESGPRVPVPEQHTDEKTAWRCEDCGGITLEDALFNCKRSEATTILP